MEGTVEKENLYSLIYELRNLEKLTSPWASLVSQTAKNLPATQETRV